jgi:hypothetical protein
MNKQTVKICRGLQCVRMRNRQEECKGNYEIPTCSKQIFTFKYSLSGDDT